MIRLFIIDLQSSLYSLETDMYVFFGQLCVLQYLLLVSQWLVFSFVMAFVE